MSEVKRNERFVIFNPALVNDGGKVITKEEKYWKKVEQK